MNNKMEEHIFKDIKQEISNFNLTIRIHNLWNTAISTWFNKMKKQQEKKNIVEDIQSTDETCECFSHCNTTKILRLNSHFVKLKDNA